MQYLRDICSGCDTLQLIVNKRYCLCYECNYKRLHGGKTREEVYRERHEKKENKKPKPKERPEVDKGELVNFLKKTFSIKKISSKRANKEKELHVVYKQIDQEREPVCEGCGRNDRPLSHSHLLSRYTRPDLTCEKDNIRLHCFGNTGGPEKTCHEKWSDFDCLEVKDMLDLKENLEYIKEVDPGVYRKMIAKFEFEGVKI